MHTILITTALYNSNLLFIYRHFFTFLACVDFSFVKCVWIEKSLCTFVFGWYSVIAMQDTWCSLKISHLFLFAVIIKFYCLLEYSSMCMGKYYDRFLIYPDLVFIFNIYLWDSLFLSLSNNTYCVYFTAFLCVSFLKKIGISFLQNIHTHVYIYTHCIFMFFTHTHACTHTQHEYAKYTPCWYISHSNAHIPFVG